MAESLSYRFAREADIGAVARLIAHSFPGGQRAPAWWEEHLRQPVYGGGPDTLWLGEAQGRVVAACQLHPLRQWIGGEIFACTGVGTVAIAPTRRKHGLGAELVATGLRAARERGDIVSALYPFRTSFYQRLGYGVADRIEQYQVPPATLADSPERERVELLDSTAPRAEALQLYQRWARTQTGQLERTERMWSQLFNTNELALVGYRAESGELEGYALVLYRTDLPPRERYLEVEELVWLTMRARRGLYAWLHSLGDQWQQLLLRALPEHRLGDWISEPRLPWGAAPSWRLAGPAATLLFGTMFRLLDVQTAWSRRHVAPGEELTIGIELDDAQIRDNVGSWRIVFADGHTTIGRAGDVAFTLRLDVSTLSRLFIGALSASAALQAGLLECDRPERLHALDALLALPEPWTFDRF